MANGNILMANGHEDVASLRHTIDVAAAAASAVNR